METQSVAEINSLIAQERATTRGFDELRPEDFFGLLIAELQSQDPLNPKDNEQLLSQMASIRQMEQNASLTRTLETLADEQRFGSTSSLIGHYIAGRVTDQSGQRIEIRGLVTGVRFEPGGAVLELHNGRFLPADKVEQVTLVENLPPHILAQLQAELAALADGDATSDPVLPEDEPGEETPAPPAEGPQGTNDPPADGGDPASGSQGDPAARWRPEMAARLREFDRGFRGMGDVLDALLSPGFEIGFG